MLSNAWNEPVTNSSAHQLVPSQAFSPLGLHRRRAFFLRGLAAEELWCNSPFFPLSLPLFKMASCFSSPLAPHAALLPQFKVAPALPSGGYCELATAQLSALVVVADGVAAVFPLSLHPCFFPLFPRLLVLAS